MPTRAAAGSTLSFASADLGVLSGLSLKIDGKEVDVTRLAATREEFDITQINYEITASAIGSQAGIDVGDIGDAVLAFNDGGGTTVANCVCKSVSYDAQKGDKVAGTYVFVPAWTTPS